MLLLEPLSVWMDYYKQLHAFLSGGVIVTIVKMPAEAAKYIKKFVQYYIIL